MRSPLGNRKVMERVTLDEGLGAFRCADTGGLYITLEQYWRWQKGTGAGPMEEDPHHESIPVSEHDDTIKICPESGMLMTRYRVGRGLPFRVDRSVTGGVWLDVGEWEALRAGGLHRNLHLVFTAPWQKAIRQAEQAAGHDNRLRDHLGDEFFSRAKAMRDEIWSHPSGAEVLAYLGMRPENAGQGVPADDGEGETPAPPASAATGEI
jgi:hypothetical protein